MGVEAPRGRPWGEPLRQDRVGGLWLVASGADAQRLRPARCIYLEHGAGQSYRGDERGRLSGSYAGGPGLDNVVLFLCPNESVAGRWREAYPEVPAVVVGCPRLDRWHLARSQQDQDEDHDENDHEDAHARVSTRRPVVAATFHWPNSLCPESQWALPHYRAALPDLATTVHNLGGELIGHGHPRAWRQLRREWAHLGVRPVPNLADVFDQADVLVADNTSALYEFASLDRPVLVLNAPWYRRGVDHGLRFWSKIPGIAIDEPEELVDGVVRALADPPDVQRHRRWVTSQVYAFTDGHAGARAASAIRALAEVDR